MSHFVLFFIKKIISMGNKTVLHIRKWFSGYRREVCITRIWITSFQHQRIIGYQYNLQSVIIIFRKLISPWYTDQVTHRLKSLANCIQLVKDRSRPYPGLILYPSPFSPTSPDRISLAWLHTELSSERVGILYSEGHFFFS